MKTKAPKTIYKTYINKRNGTISKVPAGVDPAFNFNQGNYSRDLVLFDEFMRRSRADAKKGKKEFPSRFENIAETILRNEIKKEQFESFIERAFTKSIEKKDTGRNITAIGFIDTLVKNRLMQIAGIDIGESVTVGLEARLLNGIKAKRHASKGEALEKSDADNILKCLLYGDVYFQKNNGYLIYLYKVAENRYLQMSIKPLEKKSAHRTSLTIPLVRNIQFISDRQIKSKFEANKIKWQKIK